MLADFVKDFRESFFAVRQAFPQRIVALVVKHGPKLRPVHVGVGVHHLVASHAPHKVFGLATTRAGFEFWGLVGGEKEDEARLCLGYEREYQHNAAAHT